MTMMLAPYGLGQIGVAGTSDAFEAVGFSVAENGLLPTLNGALAFSGQGEPALLGIGATGPDIANGINVEGIPVISSLQVPPLSHPNGAYEIDHLVILTPHLEQTAHVVASVLRLRQLKVQEANGHRQSFHRFAEVSHSDGSTSPGAVLELVEDQTRDLPVLWGLVFNVNDLDQVVEQFPRNVLGEAKQAVQPGRRIASFRPDAGLGIPLALMSPPPER